LEITFSAEKLGFQSPARGIWLEGPALHRAKNKPTSFQKQVLRRQSESPCRLCSQEQGHSLSGSYNKPVGLLVMGKIPAFDGTKKSPLNGGLSCFGGDG